MYCIGCDRISDELLCPSCDGKIQAGSYADLYDRRCPDCHLPILDSAYPCSWCTDGRIGWGGYEGLLARLLTLHKSRKDRRLVHYLAKLLVPMMNMIAPDLFIPVPASEGGCRQRGYDQMVLFSKELSRQMGIPSRPVLIQKKGAIVLLTRNMRIENKRIVLLDDIYTTGKTSSDCRKILKETWGIDPFVVTIAES